MHLKSLHLSTSKLPEMLSFYRDTLHCKVEQVGDAFKIDAGQSQLFFSATEVGNPTYHFAFTIAWNQVQEALEWTAGKVPLLELGPGQHLADFRNWDAKAFYFLDPAGNIVEFIAREPLEFESSTPFSGASLASVSEIGIVTDDVSLTCKQLSGLFNVPLFAKQPPTPNFAAAGDDHGLFIVVTEGRTWYPTNLAAVKAPVKAHFTTNDGEVHTLEVVI